MNENNPVTKSVIDIAKFCFFGNWRGELNEGKAAEEAKAVSKTWQDRVIFGAPDKFQKNVPICDTMKDTIELVDFKDKIAYELKVSGKNPGHEFYKNLFKILIYNQRHKLTKITRFVFITESKGIDEIEKGMGKIAAELMGKFDIAVELARLD